MQIQSTEITKNTKRPWNKGKLIGQKSPLTPQQVWAIRVRLQLANHRRDLALFNLALDSKLRGCDLVNLKLSSRKNRDLAMTTRQYGRIVKKWIGSIDLPKSSYATHSLRRTKATLIYRKTGNLRAVQLLLGHEKIDSTVKYLGVEVEDALALSESIEL